MPAGSATTTEGPHFPLCLLASSPPRLLPLLVLRGPGRGSGCGWREPSRCDADEEERKQKPKQKQKQEEELVRAEMMRRACRGFKPSPQPCPQQRPAAAMASSKRLLRSVPQEIEEEGAVEQVLRGPLLETIFRYLESDVSALHAASEVCSHWCFVDGRVRAEVTVANCYAAYPHRLTQRFHSLKRIKLKCRPRAMEFQQLAADWGGRAGDWIRAIAAKYPALESLYLKRAVVSDADLETLAAGCGRALQRLVLDKCDGFSAHGLLMLARSCRSLRTLDMASSRMDDMRGDWLKVLAVNNPRLEELLLPDPDPVGVGDDDEPDAKGPELEDLGLLVRSCLGLRSLRLGVWEQQDACWEVLAKAPALTELGTGLFPEDEVGRFGRLLPDRLVSLSGLYDAADFHLPMLLPLSGTLRNLDLKLADLSRETVMELIAHCKHLEALEVRPMIGDAGLRVIAVHCKSLKKLRVERLDVDEDAENEVTQEGITALARGCPELKFLTVYAAKLSNDALKALGENCRKLNDLRLIIVQKVDHSQLLPIDEGILYIMQRCRSLTKLALAMRAGSLTNVGLRHIGENGGSTLKWICLVCTGDDDDGLKDLLRGCRSLKRLEFRHCPFTAEGVAKAFTQAGPHLKYFWVEGAPAYAAGHMLRQLGRQRLHIEVSETQDSLSAEGEGLPEELFAYYSFRSVRDDCPACVEQLTPKSCEKLFCGKIDPES